MTDLVDIVQPISYVPAFGEGAWSGQMRFDPAPSIGLTSLPSLSLARRWTQPTIYRIRRSAGQGMQEVIEFRIQDPGQSPPWVAPVAEALFRVLNLREGWSSHASRQVSRKALSAAVSLLARVMTSDTPAPAVIPTSHGGIQFEWHQDGVDLELETTPDGQTSILIEDAETGDWWEGPVSAAGGRLRAAIERLTDSGVQG